MRSFELLRLVWLNLIQNKFKTIMTSIGIIVGAATIVMVIGIGRGGQMDIAEQFSSLNAGAIDISYEWEGETQSGGGFSFGSFDLGGMAQMFGFGQSSRGNRSSGSSNSSSGGFSGGMMGGGQMTMPGGTGTDGSSAGGFPNMAGGTGMDGGSAGGFSGGMPDMSSVEIPDDIASMMPGGNSSSEDGTGERGNRRGSSDENSDMAAGESGRGDVAGENTDGESGRGNVAGENADGKSGQSGMAGENADGKSGQSGMAGENADGASDENADSASGENADGSEADDAAGENADSAAADDAADEEDSITAERLNQENVILSKEDVEDIELFVSGITGATISYSTRSSVEGGNLTDAQTYTIAGVMEDYASLSNLSLADGYFLTEDDNDSKARVCVLGASVAKEVFGSAADAYESTIYIDDRAYTVCGVLKTSSTVSAGISPDEAVFIPYETGIKYITGENISPTVTVIAEDVNSLDSVIDNVGIVLTENYNNAEFTFADAGSKMEAAESSNQVLTLLLAAMAVIVFIVGGIGIMNVLFVSVKERTSEIGILKSLGASRSTILLEFLLESAAISLLGGILGVGASFLITPIVEHYDIRVEANMLAWGMALGFAVLTGTLFGFYPAWKASKLVPVEALNAE